MTFWSNREPITKKIKCIRLVRVAEMRLVQRERECVCVCVCVREREREREHQGLVKAAWMEADDRWTGLSKYQ